MKARSGQVALLLVVVLVAATVLTLMNVNVFLAVRAKNRTMNAGDAAALAVAKLQGELLNRIATLNVDHLRAALDGDARRCDEIVTEQMRLCFIGPLAGIARGNDAAYRNGITDEASGGMREILKDHVRDIREVFVNNLAFYPEPWPGAWEEYAEALELQLQEPLYAGPDNVDFADMRPYYPLFLKEFYHAVAGRMWCWFRDRRDLFAHDTDELAERFGGPGAAHGVDRDACNSEVYPLHLTFRPFVALGDVEKLTNLVARLTGATAEEMRDAPLLWDAAQRFACYDGHWSRWSTYPDIAFGSETFPVDGEVKTQYDVLGCSATCRVQADAEDILDAKLFADSDWDHLERGRTSSGETKVINWNASAKPFGWIEGAEGEATDVFDETGARSGASPVTAWFGLVVPRTSEDGAATDETAASDAASDGTDTMASDRTTFVNAFSDVRLVPVDAVCRGIDASMADRAWVQHVKYHLPTSPQFAGRHRLPAGHFTKKVVACWYCDQLDQWDNAWFRRSGRRWLENRENEKSCERYRGPGPSATGGSIHAH